MTERTERKWADMCTEETEQNNAEHTVIDRAGTNVLTDVTTTFVSSGRRLDGDEANANHGAEAAMGSPMDGDTLAIGEHARFMGENILLNPATLFVKKPLDSTSDLSSPYLSTSIWWSQKSNIATIFKKRFRTSTS